MLQEDERMFYPGGDDQLRCQQLLARQVVGVLLAQLSDPLVALGEEEVADDGPDDGQRRAGSEIVLGTG